MTIPRNWQINSRSLLNRTDWGTAARAFGRLTVLLALSAGWAEAQSIETAFEQLREARKSGSEAGYQKAEETLNALLARDASNAEVVFARGMARLDRSGWYAQNSKFGPAQQVLAEAFADLDRAVELRPNDGDLRLKRARIYARFPDFLGKSGTARQDLQALIQRPDFESKPVKARAETRLLLGQLLTRAGEVAEARQQFEMVKALAPDGAEGISAESELAKLADAPAAKDARGRPMPDRFPQVSGSVTPVIVAASVTFQKQAGDPAKLRERVAWIVDGLKGQPGLLGAHVLTSLDEPGMVTILTWWKDKMAVNNFFYGEAHQGMIRRMYGNPPAEVEATQVSVELFATLPAGRRIGGGITPEAALNEIK